MNVSTFPEVDLPAGSRPVVTFGNFDGVHRGHQRIVEEVRARARARGAPAVAVTFEPHPMSVLRPEQAPRRILSPAQKVELLGGLDLDLLLVIPFTLDLSRVEPEEFVRAVVVEKLHAAELVLGGNFRFGRARRGDLELLRRLGGAHDYRVDQVPPALHEGEMISSSRIRKSLGEGRVEEAEAMLGRPYFVDGEVVPGQGRGEDIGYPTANLRVEGDLLAADGIYVTLARVGDRLHPGMSHVGPVPTFGIETRSVETHLFDFSGRLYGARLRLHFLRWIRPVETFSGIPELRAALDADRRAARSYFEEREGNPGL